MPKQKQLADFLQEQQEPFALEAYLVERGYSKHLQGCSAKYAPPNCSHFLRCVFSHFVLADAHNRRNAIAENTNASSQTSSCSAEDSKKLSPTSVLDEDEDEDEDEDSPIHHKHHKFKAQGQHSNSRRNGFQESQKLNPYDYYFVNKKDLKDGKHLMINECSIFHLLHSEFLASIGGWRSEFEEEKLKVSMEIENVILEDVINEIIIY